MQKQMNEKRNSHRWWAFGIAILICSMVLTGCGSDNNNSASEKSTVSSNNGSSPEAPSGQAALEYEAAEDRITDPAATANRIDMAEEAPEQSDADTYNVSVGATASDLSAYDRKLIYNANVVLEVEDYGDAQTKLFDMVTLAGGYMLNFNDMMSSYETGGVFVIKVPSNGFHPFVSKLEALKKKDTEAQRNIEGKDVTEEYVDIASRLKAKQVVEARLLSFMEKAIDTKNLLQFSNELARVQEEIEAIKGRMRYIDQNVAFSTVEIRMYERLDGEQTLEKKKDNVLSRAGDAMKGSGKAVLAMFEGVLIVLAGALPILLVVGLIAALIWLIYRKTRYNGTRQSTSSYVTSVDQEAAKDQAVTSQIEEDKD